MRLIILTSVCVGGRDVSVFLSLYEALGSLSVSVHTGWRVLWGRLEQQVRCSYTCGGWGERTSGGKEVGRKQGKDEGMRKDGRKKEKNEWRRGNAAPGFSLMRRRQTCWRSATSLLFNPPPPLASTPSNSLTYITHPPAPPPASCHLTSFEVLTSCAMLHSLQLPQGGGRGGLKPHTYRNRFKYFCFSLNVGKIYFRYSPALNSHCSLMLVPAR